MTAKPEAASARACSEAIRLALFISSPNGGTYTTTAFAGCSTGECQIA